MIMQILQLLKEKTFGGDDDTETELAAIKGLYVYLIDTITEEGVIEDVEYANAVEKINIRHCNINSKSV